MNFLIGENEYFKFEHCYSCAIPGYLIVTPKAEANSIYDLPKSHQEILGESLAIATKTVREVIQPIKIYCAQFGEEATHLHFHIFPRTQSVTDRFLKSFPEQHDLIHGPVLLDWARTYYKQPQDDVWPKVCLVIDEMRQYYESHRKMEP